jgi:hypothetical protein
MLMTPDTSTISKNTANDGYAGWPPLASWHLSKPANPVVKIAEQVVYVCFPVILPGEDGRVIPFGRYHLVARNQSRPQLGRPHQAMLVNGDNGARIDLSAQQLNAIVQDPDVEFY